MPTALLPPRTQPGVNFLTVGVAIGSVVGSLLFTSLRGMIARLDIVSVGGVIGALPSRQLLPMSLPPDALALANRVRLLTGGGMPRGPLPSLLRLGLYARTRGAILVPC